MQAVHDEIHWRTELGRWLEEHGPTMTDEASTIEEQIRNVLVLTRALVRGIVETHEHLQVIDHTKYDFIEERLDTLVSFEEFSLAEVSFQLGDKQRPGVRLWLDGPADRRRLRLIFFEDVVKWRVDRAGEKVSTTLVAFELSPNQIVVVDPDDTQLSWDDVLVEGFSALVEQLSDPD